MEVVPFAWLIMRTARRAAEWGETPDKAPRREHVELVVLGLLAPLMRPEGALFSLLAAATLLAFPRGRRRAWALVPLAGPLVMPLIELAATGQFGSTTAEVKWLPENPYYAGARLTEAVSHNLVVLFNTLLDGRIWSAVFIPQGARWITWLALPALAIMAVRRGRRWRGLCVGVVALGILATTTYDSFLWNRLRYLWPFAAAWFVALGALADGVGAIAARLSPGLGWVRVLVAGAFVGALASHLSYSIDDVATSARRHPTPTGRTRPLGARRAARRRPHRRERHRRHRVLFRSRNLRHRRAHDPRRSALLGRRRGLTLRALRAHVAERASDALHRLSAVDVAALAARPPAHRAQRSRRDHPRRHHHGRARRRLHCARLRRTSADRTSRGQDDRRRARRSRPRERSGAPLPALLGRTGRRRCTGRRRRSRRRRARSPLARHLHAEAVSRGVCSWPASTRASP